MRKWSWLSLLILAGASGTVCADEPETQHYLVEALFHEGELFLGQQALPRKGRELMRAVAFDVKGKAIDPPDPGYERLKHQFAEIIRIPPAPPPPPPLAETTHYYGAQVRGGGVSVHVSDLGTGLPAPRAIGEIRLIVFNETLFRIERVATAPQPLLQDQAHYRRRLKVIIEEMQQEVSTLRERRESTADKR